MKKLIIEVRVNEYAMRAGNPNVPWTAEEIGRDARAIRDAGASILHFHARKPDGTPAHATEDYAAAIRAIRANSDLLVHPTLGQITLAGQEERMRHIVELSKDRALRPDIAAIDTGSTNIDVYDARAKAFRTANKVYVNAHDTLMLFCRLLRECGVKPCFSAWTSPFLRTADALLDMDLVGEPAYALLVHCEGGILGGHPANSYGLRAFRDHLPQDRHIEWTVCCKEGNLFPAAMTAIAEGGHVAIGIGDYAYPELGQPTNADLVREIVHMAKLVGREVATPEEARQMLGM
jgi:3-keto-5-aminohexanoate cleavage enzyme